MSANSVLCPHCSTPLRSSQPLPAGQRVRCPRCSNSFAVPGNGIHAPANGLQRSPAPGYRPAPPEEAPRRTNRAALLGIILGSILLLGGAAVGLAFMFAGPSGSGDPQGNKSNKDDQRHAVTDDTRRDTTRRDDATRDNTRPRDDVQRPRDDTRPRDDRRPKDDGRPKDDSRPKDDKRNPNETPVNLTTLPPAEQEKVNKAIDKGIEYLRLYIDPRPRITVTATYQVGVYTLPALTLLECGIPADDPGVQYVAKMVRDKGPTLEKTYEIALAVLFLDKLGDPKDKPLIQKLGLRLIAGQTAGGGWSYNCPLLDDAESRDLLLALDRTKSTSAKDLGLEITSKNAGPNDPDPTPKPEGKPDFAKAVEGMSAKVKKVQAVKPPPDAKAKFPTQDRSEYSEMPSDNSNTQFGLLGVWVAGRHGIPTERPLALVARRFRASQMDDGSWGYWYLDGPGREKDKTPAMTAAGLLGLAVGHGLVSGAQRDDSARQKIDDPNVNKALAALSKHLDGPLGVAKDVRDAAREKNEPQPKSDLNLYFLWSVERVGVLYNTRKIGDKDWYAWGAKLLLEHQDEDGKWDAGGYNGSYSLVDTSFALLFLKRANLVKELSNKLEFVIDSK